MLPPQLLQAPGGLNAGAGVKVGRRAFQGVSCALEALTVTAPNRLPDRIHQRRELLLEEIDENAQHLLVVIDLLEQCLPVHNSLGVTHFRLLLPLSIWLVG